MASRASDLGRLTVPVPCFRSQISPHTHPDTLGSFQLFSRPFFVIFSVFWGFFFASQKIIQLMHGTIIHIWVPTSQFVGAELQNKREKRAKFLLKASSSLLHLSPTLFTKAAARRGCSIRISSAQCLPSEAASVIQADAIAFPLERGAELQTVPSITREVILQIRGWVS